MYSTYSVHVHIHVHCVYLTRQPEQPLAVAYQLVLDNRVVNQAAHDTLTLSHEPVESVSPPNAHGWVHTVLVYMYNVHVCV